MQWQRLKPGVSGRVLLFISGAMWVGVGAMLLVFATTWLHPISWHKALALAAAGAGGGLVIHHFGFLRVVDRNIARIEALGEGACVFAFMAWKSYLLVAVMVTMGIMLRHSAIPKPYLAVLYISIGLGLLLSSVRYLRHAVRPSLARN
jgi:hypothetical protein